MKIYNSKGGPKFGGLTKISFKDHGSGIDEKHIEKIFDPFFSTKPVGVGTGLGLSVSYGIIEDHGGKISVESKKNEGATFFIELPVIVPSMELNK